MGPQTKMGEDGPKREKMGEDGEDGPKREKMGENGEDGAPNVRKMERTGPNENWPQRGNGENWPQRELAQK